ncbi:MAG: lysoplasmalogenase [Bacteroidia bacterium]
MAELFHLQALTVPTKILLMPSLALWYFYLTKTQGAIKMLLAALFFSWGGDTLLVFAKEKPIFFLLGLGSFFLAHVFYIYTFVKKGKEFKLTTSSVALIVIALLNLATLLYLLLPVLPIDMKVPILAYGSILTLLICSTLYLRKLLAAHWAYLLLGVALFILSDSLIAFNRFRFDMIAFLPNISFWIMLTYIIAQGCIVWACAKISR